MTNTVHTLTIRRLMMPSGEIIAEAVCTCGDHFGNAIVHHHIYPCDATCRAQMTHPPAGATDAELLAVIDGGWHAAITDPDF